MPHLNVEIKAKCNNQDTTRQLLHEKNALFHGIDHQIDTVKGLGSFIEIEASDRYRRLSRKRKTTRTMSQQYLDLCQIPPENLIAVSYSDMLMKKVQE